MCSIARQDAYVTMACIRNHEHCSKPAASEHCNSSGRLPRCAACHHASHFDACILLWLAPHMACLIKATKHNAQCSICRVKDVSTLHSFTSFHKLQSMSKSHACCNGQLYILTCCRDAGITRSPKLFYAAGTCLDL